MSVGAQGKAIITATNGLLAKWEDTRTSWQDAKAAEFERRFVFELKATVDRVTPAFEHLDKLVSKVRSDCE